MNMSRENTVHHSEYLSCLWKLIDNLLSQYLVVDLAKASDSDDIRRYFSNYLSQVILSSILTKIAMSHVDEVEDILEKIFEIVKEFKLQDMAGHHEDRLLERLNRWKEKFINLPETLYPKSRNRPGVKKKKPNRLECQLEYEKVCDSIKAIKNSSRSESEIIARLSEEFPQLQSNDDFENIAVEIQTVSVRSAAVLLLSIFHGVEPETYKKHWIGGARKMSQKIDLCLKL